MTQNTSTSPQDIAAWIEFLDSYEAKILSTEAALDTGAELDPEVLQPFEEPTHLSPLPAELKERAIEVLRINEQLERRLGVAMGVLSQEVARATQAAGNSSRFSAFAESVIPHYFDNHA